MKQKDEPVKIVTIAGSDSGGAAGLQADLKTFTALGAYGMSVVTVVTAQNSVKVEAVYRLPPEMVARQLKTVLEDYGCHAVKTGFIGDSNVILTIARELRHYRSRHAFFLIVDPVLVNYRGEPMFDSTIYEAYREHLLPLCDLVTPNCAEAALLASQPVRDVIEMQSAARRLYEWGARSALITGGREGNRIVDLFYDGESVNALATSWIETENTHGAGDTLSAATSVFLAQGMPMPEAVRQAQAFTVAAIRNAVTWRLGAGHGPLNHLRIDP